MITSATARQPALPPGIPEMHQPHRAHDTRWRPGPCHPRQRHYSQAQGRPGLARTPSALDLPRHLHFERVAERARRRLRQADTTPSQIRRLPLRTRTPGRHPPRHRRTQHHRSQALRLARRSRYHHRRKKKRGSSVEINPLARRGGPASRAFASAFGTAASTTFRAFAHYSLFRAKLNILMIGRGRSRYRRR